MKNRRLYLLTHHTLNTYAFFFLGVVAYGVFVRGSGWPVILAFTIIYLPAAGAMMLYRCPHCAKSPFPEKGPTGSSFGPLWRLEKTDTCPRCSGRL